jgi:hypothetical protein
MLLTDEEIMQIRRDLGGMYQREFDLIQAGANAEHSKTLKAVGEWLNRNTACGDNQSGLYRAIKWEHIEALLRGEMPE